MKRSLPRLGTGAAAFLMLVASPTWACAQASRVPDPREPASPNDGSRSAEEEGRRVMNSYARCVVNDNRRRVMEFLSVLADSSQARQILPRLATSDCLVDGWLRFRPHLFRGSLFEALYQTRFGQSQADLRVAPVVTYFQRAEGGYTTVQREWLLLHDFADCVTRAAPTQVRRLIATRVTTPWERTAFAELNPFLGACLVQGAQLSFSQPVMRGLLAESLYRLTEAAAPANPQQASR